MSVFTATSFWNIQPVAVGPVGPTYSTRADAYAQYLAVAQPMSTFSTLGMANWYDNIATVVNGSTISTSYKLVPTGSAGGLIYPSASVLLFSGSNWATNGYTSSGFLSGSQNYGVITTASPSGSFGTQNFVIECYFKQQSPFSNPPFQLHIFGDNSGDHITMQNSTPGNIWRFYTNGTVLNASFTLTTNTWYHLAMVRSGTNKYIYLNGTRIGSGTFSGAISPPGSGFWSILGFNSGNTNDGVGKVIQDFRYYLGTDKGYTGATITVPPSIVVAN
jgi:hypothetical protein